MSEGVGSEAWLRNVFDEDARDDIFTGHAPTPQSPVLVLLGGQPAAGKTRAQEAIVKAHADTDLVLITGDDLREYHPGYPRLAAEAPLEMPAATAPVSGGLVRLALENALAHRYSVLLEGTFRDPDMVTGTATRFADAGYRVEVAAVATPAPVSRLSAEQRALGDGGYAFGRWTPPDAHETALAGSADVVAALEGLPFVTRVQVHTRERLLYDNTRTAEGAWTRPAQAAEVLRSEQQRDLDPADAMLWLSRYEAVFEHARQRPGYLTAATFPAYQRLQADARRMIDIAATAPGIEVRALRDAHKHRDLALRVANPAPWLGLFPRSRRAPGTSPPDPDDGLWQSPHRPSSRKDPPTLGR